MPAALKTLIYALLITFSSLVVGKVANAHNQDFDLCTERFVSEFASLRDNPNLESFIEENSSAYSNCLGIIFGLIGAMHENCLFLRANDFFGITDKSLLPKHGDFSELYDGRYLKNGSFVSINQLIVDIGREDMREVAGYAPRMAKLYPCKE